MAPGRSSIPMERVTREVESLLDGAKPMAHATTVAVMMARKDIVAEKRTGLIWLSLLDMLYNECR